jgi:hypothetical protein
VRKDYEGRTDERIKKEKEMKQSTVIECDISVQSAQFNKRGPKVQIVYNSTQKKELSL